jgi:uncharacterized protein YceK
MKNAVMIATLLLLAGCAGVQKHIETGQVLVCRNADKIKAAALATIQNVDRICAASANAQ